jgi:hypothetical protein
MTRQHKKAAKSTSRIFVRFELKVININPDDLSIQLLATNQAILNPFQESGLTYSIPGFSFLRRTPALSNGH